MHGAFLPHSWWHLLSQSVPFRIHVLGPFILFLHFDTSSCCRGCHLFAIIVGLQCVLHSWLGSNFVFLSMAHCVGSWCQLAQSHWFRCVSVHNDFVVHRRRLGRDQSVEVVADEPWLFSSFFDCLVSCFGFQIVLCACGLGGYGVSTMLGLLLFGLVTAKELGPDPCGWRLRVEAVVWCRRNRAWLTLRAHVSPRLLGPRLAIGLPYEPRP